jgi:hypothetical protein
MLKTDLFEGLSSDRMKGMIISRDGPFHVPQNHLPLRTNEYMELSRTCLSLDFPLQSNILRGLVHIAPLQLKAPQAMRLHMLLAIVLT